MRAAAYATLVLLALTSAAFAQTDDAEGCTDHPLFNRMPGFHIARCDSAQFDIRRYPVGPPPAPESNDLRPKMVDVEGAFTWLAYEMEEDGKRPSAMQTMRNFQNAARKAGGSVEGEYPDWCKADMDETMTTGNPCIFWGTTMKFAKGGRETWAFLTSGDEGRAYELYIVEREAMKQDIAATEMRETLESQGFIALYIDFATGTAAIEDASMSQLDQVAQLLKASGELELDVVGHTDNTGTPDANQKLSDARAASVVAALVARGIAADRLVAKGLGQTAPIADNRTEEGRAKNRRVELVKR